MDAVLVTGFGPFLGVAENPSLAVARALAADPLLGRELGIQILAAELPVVLGAVPAAFDAALREAQRARSVLAVLSLGVQRDLTFRLERRARHELHAQKPDNAGVVAAGLILEPARTLATCAPCADLLAALREAGAPAVVDSDDAGGFVCERTYHHVLARCEPTGLPAVFLHVPPAEAFPAALQVPIVAALLRALVRAARADPSRSPVP